MDDEVRDDVAFLTMSNPIICAGGWHLVGLCRQGRQSVALTSTHPLVFPVPVLLLAFYRAVTRVPAAVVHCLFLAVVTLEAQKQKLLKTS